MKSKKFRLTNTQIIVLSFFMVIITGAVLLTLPISSKSGEWTGFFPSLFTATSATCVTGLSVYDTYTHWSLFGQIVILLLIQIGGLGFMSIITMFSVFMKRRISLHERRLLMQSAGNVRLGGMVKLLKKIFIGTFTFEALGAIVLAFRLCPDMGFGKGLFSAVFHSVSAFCNAGFDLMGYFVEGSSLSHYSDDWLVNLTVIMLIVVGGLGFLVWEDVVRNRFRFKKYSLHSKIVLSMTGALLVTGFIGFFIFEYNEAFRGLSLPDKILASMFQSVTPRTAGFFTVDLNNLSDSGNVLTIVLMLIGGSPGSTAGGMKTTTIAVVVLGALASARKSKTTEIYKRRLDEGILHQACSILVIYILVVLMSTMIISHLESVPLDDIVFEVTSAIGTVGLSKGITASLSSVSQAILIVLMFAGRVGGLSLLLFFAEKREVSPIRRPVENILVG